MPINAARQMAFGAAWRDARRFTALFLIAATLLATYHATRFHFGDYRDIFTYHSMEGPFHTVLAEDGTRTMGAPLVTAAPGETIGWMSTICLVPGNSMRAVLQLHRKFPPPAADAMPAQEYNIVATETRCGPRAVFLALDGGLPDGLYEETRIVHLREGTVWPLIVAVPPIAISIRRPEPGTE